MTRILEEADFVWAQTMTGLVSLHSLPERPYDVLVLPTQLAPSVISFSLQLQSLGRTNNIDALSDWLRYPNFANKGRAGMTVAFGSRNKDWAANLC